MTSLGSLVTNKLKRKQRRERVRSLSKEERAEALITNHLIPLIIQKMAQEEYQQSLED